MGVKFGMEEALRSPSSMPNVTHQFNDMGVEPQKLKLLLRFDQNVEYKRPAGAWEYRNDFERWIGEGL